VSDQTVALSNERNGEVENELECQHLTVVIDMQVNFGYEISMNDTNYLISSQRLLFTINTNYDDINVHSDLFSELN
jgi:hypothetical protein